MDHVWAEHERMATTHPGRLASPLEWAGQREAICFSWWARKGSAHILPSCSPSDPAGGVLHFLETQRLLLTWLVTLGGGGVFSPRNAAQLSHAISIALGSVSVSLSASEVL